MNYNGLDEETFKQLKECHELIYKVHFRHLKLFSSSEFKIGLIIIGICTISFVSMVIYTLIK